MLNCFCCLCYSADVKDDDTDDDDDYYYYSTCTKIYHNTTINGMMNSLRYLFTNNLLVFV